MDPKFGGLERTTTPEGVYRVLRAAILDGTVPPGDSCARGTSRRTRHQPVPLREALTRLEEEGLVVKIPFRGAFVVEVSAQEVAEIASIRLLVEPYAGELALEALRGPERPRLTQTIEDLTGPRRTTSRPASMRTSSSTGSSTTSRDTASCVAFGTAGRPSCGCTSRSTIAPTATCTTSPSSTSGWPLSRWKATRTRSGENLPNISSQRYEPPRGSRGAPPPGTLERTTSLTRSGMHRRGLEFMGGTDSRRRGSTRGSPD